MKLLLLMVFMGLKASASCNFEKVREGEVDLESDEKVLVLDVKNGYASIQKSNGKVGKCPNYYLTMDEIPGNNFAQQIKYRREWYQRVDETPSNPRLTASCSLPFQTATSSTSDNFDVLLELSKCERPVVVEELVDMEATEGTDVEMNPIISSQTDFTMIWHGPAVESKRARIQSNQLSSRLLIKHVKKCDTGAYSVIARNEFGVTSSVAFLNVVSTPEVPIDFCCKITGDHEIRLKWKQEDGLKYCIEFRINDDETSNDPSFKVASTNIEKAHVSLRNFSRNSYTFRVFAYNQRTRSDASNCVNVDFTKNQVY